MNGLADERKGLALNKMPGCRLGCSHADQRVACEGIKIALAQETGS